MAIARINQVKSWLRNHRVELAFAGMALLLLGPLLRPGFIFALDMVWPEKWVMRLDYERYRYSQPLQWLFVVLGTFMPQWAVQKLVLFLTFFGGGLIAYRCLTVSVLMEVRFFAVLLYVFNPYVYIRFIAGHWMILAAYMLLPWVTYSLFRISKQPSVRSAVGLTASLWCVQLFSIHLFIMALLVCLVWFCLTTLAVAKHKEQKHEEEQVGRVSSRSAVVYVFILSAVMLAVTTAYWTVPAYFEEYPSLYFSKEDLKAFAPSMLPGNALWMEMIFLGGFWAERLEWAKSFLWPFNSCIMYGVGPTLVGLIGVGIISAIKQSGLLETLFFGMLILGGFIFASSVTPGPFQGINLWSYEHLPFWKGFRDSHKWLALVALGYAVFASHGLEYLIQKSKRRIISKASFLASVAVVFCFSWTIFWGAAGKMRIGHYPPAYEKVAGMIAQDELHELTLFLPWHRYYFTRYGGLIDTPAYFMFWPRAVTCRNLEIGRVPRAYEGHAHEQLDRLLANNRSSPRLVVKELQRLGIKRVVFFKDIVGRDIYRYPYLFSDLFESVYEDNDVTVLELSIP